MAAQTWIGALAAAVVVVLKANGDLYQSDGSGLVKKIEVGLIDPIDSQEISAADCDYISVSVPMHGADTKAGAVGFAQFPAVIRMSVITMGNPQSVAEIKMQTILSQLAYILTGQKGSTPFGVIATKVRASMLEIGEGKFEHKKSQNSMWMLSGANQSSVLVDVDGH